MNERKNLLTEYGMSIKNAILRAGKTQNWLIEEVKRKHPNIFIDSSSLNKILIGGTKTGAAVDAINEIMAELRREGGETPMNEDKILAAIAELNESVKGRLDGIEERLEAVEKQYHITSKLAKDLYAHQRKQSEDIDELFRRLDALYDSGKVIWRSRDGRESAYRSNDIYDIIRECGYGRGEALRIIDAAGRLSKDKRHYTKPVRIGNRVQRAIVIFEKE